MRIKYFNQKDVTELETEINNFAIRKVIDKIHFFEDKISAFVIYYSDGEE
jgi:hypothetical protein